MSATAARLEALDASLVSDALESLGLPAGVGGISRVWACNRVAGPAITVRLRPLGPQEIAPQAFHLGAQAIERSSRGDVIVVAHQGRSDSAGWGGLLSAAAATAGVRGVIVDGACRDVEDAERVQLPLFARSATPVTARGRTVEDAFNVPIEVGGRQVMPGDYVLADRSGIVFLPSGQVDAILARAEVLMSKERTMLSHLAGGVPVSRIMNGDYETMLDRSGLTDAPPPSGLA